MHGGGGWWSGRKGLTGREEMDREEMGVQRKGE